LPTSKTSELTRRAKSIASFNAAWSVSPTLCTNSRIEPSSSITWYFLTTYLFRFRDNRTLRKLRPSRMGCPILELRFPCCLVRRIGHRLSLCLWSDQVFFRISLPS